MFYSCWKILFWLHFTFQEMTGSGPFSLGKLSGALYNPMEGCERFWILFSDKGLRMLGQGIHRASAAPVCQALGWVPVSSWMPLLLKLRGIFGQVLLIAENFQKCGLCWNTDFPRKREISVLVSITAGHLKIWIPGKAAGDLNHNFRRLSFGCSLHWWVLGTS